MRVLAIDDIADNLVVLTALLRSYLPGCETATARNGLDGLALARTFQPDVILLDIQMPEMDGYQVCRALKATPETLHIPVVFLTARSSTPASRIQALECGGDAFLDKPVEPGELMAQVRAMVRIKQAEEALRGENRSLGQDVADRTGALDESQRLIAAIVDGTPDSIWAKDRAGRFLLANAAELFALGRPASEVIGRTAAELLGPAEASFVEEADRRVLDEGETFTQEEPTSAAGRVRTFLATRGPVRDAEGRITGVFGVSRDFSDSARARLVLQKETERVKALLALYRLPGRGTDDVVCAAVEGLTVLSESEVGLVGIPAQDCAAMQAQVWSARPLAAGESRTFQHLLDAGDAYSEAIRTRQPVVLEGPEAETRRAFPAGYPAVRRFMAVPVVREGRVVLVGGVANSELPYGEFVLAQAELYLEGAWEAMQKVKFEEQRGAQEQEARQAAKMEAVGRLAGGIAHDFNNLLVVILSYARFAIDSVGEAHPLRPDLEEILKAGERAATLTRQLLAHSRKQVLQVATLDLNEVVTGIDPMLRRLLREDLELNLQLADGLWAVRSDRGQLEQVIVNLAVNARDAIPKGGRITVRTVNLAARSEPGTGPWEGPGVLLEVTDTGVGMDEPTRSHAFEPFFTTKEKGKGTGLGLATVYGIVKQSGGDIRVESVPGVGTTFRILLPRSEEVRALTIAPPQATAARGPVAASFLDQGTILVVEDEEAVRILAERILVSAGYRVVTATGGGEALDWFAVHGREVALLLTDVVMPQMSGHELARQLTELRPGLKVIYMSGYLDDVLGEHGVLPAEIKFIGKPFAPHELVRQVRDALFEPPPGSTLRDMPAVAPRAALRDGK